MIVSLRHVLGWMVSAVGSREDLILENLALRQQLLALHAKRPHRRLTALHRLFWVALRTFWTGWKKPLVLVTPRTVVNWHRAGFRLYWTWVSRAKQVGGRKRVTKEVRTCSLGCATIATSVGLQTAHRFLLFDRDSKFGADRVSAVRDIGSHPTRTAFRSPWQNGVAERWVGSCRRDLLDHVIVLNKRHLKRLMAEYVGYYHEDRTHLGLAKDTPAGRTIALPSGTERKIQSLPRLGGLHHRYAVAA
jgi:transposase InsO family protein